MKNQYSYRFIQILYCLFLFLLPIYRITPQEMIGYSLQSSQPYNFRLAFGLVGTEAQCAGGGGAALYSSVSSDLDLLKLVTFDMNLQFNYLFIKFHSDSSEKGVQSGYSLADPIYGIVQPGLLLHITDVIEDQKKEIILSSTWRGFKRVSWEYVLANIPTRKVFGINIGDSIGINPHGFFLLDDAHIGIEGLFIQNSRISFQPSSLGRIFTPLDIYMVLKVGVNLIYQPASQTDLIRNVGIFLYCSLDSSDLQIPILKYLKFPYWIDILVGYFPKSIFGYSSVAPGLGVKFALGFPVQFSVDFLR